MRLPVYMDNHATTCVDPRVVEAMLPFFTDIFGNAGSVSHSFGWQAKEAVDAARASIAEDLGADTREIVFTSGATESNNLAIRGVVERSRHSSPHVISVQTEHRAVLDPLRKLSRRGVQVTLLPPHPAGDNQAGRIDIDQLADAIRPETILVSVMLANNEIGVIQPLAQVAEVCKSKGVLVHSDATQAAGKIPVDVNALNVDLLSLTAHKIYGPKGIGALYVRGRNPQVRLEPQIDGGGQEGGRRSGTLNVPGIVGLAKALRLCVEEMQVEQPRLARLRDRLFAGIQDTLEGVWLNGPSLDDPALRLAGNLNVGFGHVDGEALMMNMRDVAVSSGSACSSADPEPSHVLRALGLSEDQVRSSLRFGLGRFNTEEQVEFAVRAVAETVTRLRRLSAWAAG